MKTVRIALILFLVLTSSLTFAQRKTYLGVNGGMNFGTVDLFHSYNGYSFIPGFTQGFQGGIVVMNYLENHFGIQAGLSYVQKGWKQQFDNGEPDYGTYLDYVELPFLASLHTGDKNLHFYISAGCFFEYLVQSSVDPTPQNPGIYDVTVFDPDRDFKYGYGFKVAGGAFYDFRFGTIMLDINGSYSLSQTLNPPSLASDVPNISNRINVGWTLGYLFKFPTKENK